MCGVFSDELRNLGFQEECRQEQQPNIVVREYYVCISIKISLLSRVYEESG